MLKKPEQYHPRETPESEPAKLLHGASELQKFSRRTLLGMGALAGVAFTDMIYTKEIQRERNYVDIKTISNKETYNTFPNSSWLFFPGFKTSWEEADWMASTLEPTMKERGQIARVGYSNTGFDMDTIYRAVRTHIAKNNLTDLFFYGHSFGGMAAVEIAARLQQDETPVNVRLISLDSTPHSRYDVKDQQMFDDIALTYNPEYLTPSTARAVMELSERVVHKNERSWLTVFQQTIDQLKPAAPSTQLMQTEAVYIYGYHADRYSNRLNPNTRISYMGNPLDDTVDFHGAVAGWKQDLPHNFLASPYSTTGTHPAHASPQWNGGIYNMQLREIQHFLLPLPNTKPSGVKNTLKPLPA
jgi:pimeloyl-ACP methyl ester carboxylesterase